MPLFPTASGKGTGLPAALFKVKVPVVPCNPPKMAVLSVPKLSVPAPLASKVLIKRAAELPKRANRR